MILALLGAALAAPYCIVSGGVVVRALEYDGKAPYPVPDGARLVACPAGTGEGWGDLGKGRYAAPAPAPVEPPPPDLETERAQQLAAVASKASATDARQVDALARIATLEAQIAELRAEIERLKAGR